MSQLFENNQSREAWIDVTKALALFLVSITHLHTFFSFYDWAYITHIPTFLFLGGFVYATSRTKALSFVSFVRVQCKKLLAPYVLTGLGLFLILIFFDWHFPNVTLDGFLLDIFRGRPKSVAGSLWFLPAFFLVRVLFYLMERFVRFRPLIALIGIGAYGLSVYFNRLGHYGMWWSLDIVPAALFFYTAGWLARPLDSRFQLSTPLKAALAYGLFMVSYLFGNMVRLIGGTSPNLASNLVTPPAIYVVGSVTGIATLLLLGSLLRESRYLRWVGERTMGIFMWHLLFLLALKPLLPDLSNGFLRLGLSTIISVVLITALGFATDWVRGWRSTVFEQT